MSEVRARDGRAFFFRAAGKGHLTRMAKVLKAYAQSHGKRAEG